MTRFIAAFSVIAVLGGCAGPIGRSNPLQAWPRASQTMRAPQGYVWARNDGRRMSDNPALLRQGQKDQSACRLDAMRGGALDQGAFSACMHARGYTARPAS